MRSPMMRLLTRRVGPSGVAWYAYIKTRRSPMMFDLLANIVSTVLAAYPETWLTVTDIEMAAGTKVNQELEIFCSWGNVRVWSIDWRTI